MQKRIGFAVSKTKIFFSLCSISNHALTIILRLSQCLSFPETPGFLNCCPLPGSSKEVISHNASLLPSPQFSLSDALFLGAQGGDQSLLPPAGVGSCLGIGPRALPYPVAIPGEWVHPSNEYSWGLAVWRVGKPVQKRTRNTVRWRASSFVSGFLHSSLAESPVWCLKGLVWLESCWGLKKCCRNQ